MYGILPLTNEEIKEDLDLILSLEPKHISTYSLILEEKTILYHKYLNNQFKLVDPDIEAASYYFIQEYRRARSFCLLYNLRQTFFLFPRG